MKQLAFRFVWFMIVFSTSLGLSTAQPQGLGQGTSPPGILLGIPHLALVLTAGPARGEYS